MFIFFKVTQHYFLFLLNPLGCHSPATIMFLLVQLLCSLRSWCKWSWFCSLFQGRACGFRPETINTLHSRLNSMEPAWDLENEVCIGWPGKRPSLSFFLGLINVSWNPIASHQYDKNSCGEHVRVWEDDIIWPLSQNTWEDKYTP